MKINREGKATIISRDYYHKIRENFKSEIYALIFQIGIFTGERWGAICQLKIGNVYQDIARRIPKPYLIYPAEIRKASPGGKRYSRQVKICPELAIFLKAYELPLNSHPNDWLFPSPLAKCGSITRRAADKALRDALKGASLDHLGISTHSTRRTFITNLYRQGATIAELQAITGHRTVKALLEYIEVDLDRVEGLVNDFSLAFG